jgi:hypothetical protein
LKIIITARQINHYGLKNKIKGGELMNVPFAISQFLYKGIISEIQFLKMRIEDNRFNNYDKRKFDDLKEALEWYKENCIISSIHLEKEFATLKQMQVDYKNSE